MCHAHFCNWGALFLYCSITLWKRPFTGWMTGFWSISLDFSTTWHYFLKRFVETPINNRHLYCAGVNLHALVQLSKLYTYINTIYAVYLMVILIWLFGEFVFIHQIKCTHCLHSYLCDLDNPCCQTKNPPIYINTDLPNVLYMVL